MTVLVAGSGPAGVFAALGALEAGANVVMIDPGLSLTPEHEALKQSLRDIPWRAWSAAQWAAIKRHFDIRDKRVFGSDHATRQGGAPDVEQVKCQIWRSQARGGLSNLWGRGIEPPYGDEARHWPFHAAFEDALRRVLARIPFAAVEDNLARAMPLHRAPDGALPATPESRALLDRWNARAESLNRSGIHFGQTRLAADVKSCITCGLCFYGCAWDAMFETSQLLTELRRDPRFEYRPGWRVTRWERGATPRVEVESIADGAVEWLEPTSLVLAAGAAETTRLAMRSCDLARVVMKNSDMLRIPLFRLWGDARGDVPFHALSQLTLTFKTSWLSRNAMVMHLFGRNPLISAALPAFARRLLERRLYIGMCFLHSRDSSEIAWEATEARTLCTGVERGRTLRAWLRVMLFLFRHVMKTGLLPIPCPGSVTLPGASVHSGASLSVDASGALRESPRTYVADAAGLPEIPAGSYTLSIMANALRVGGNAAAAS